MVILTDGTVYQAVSVDVNAGVTADVDAAVAAASGLRLVGFTVRESDGTPAVATGQVVNGATVAGGTAIATFELAANESKTYWMWPGIDAASGITVDHIGGTFDIELYYITVA